MISSSIYAEFSANQISNSSKICSPIPVKAIFDENHEIVTSKTPTVLGFSRFVVPLTSVSPKAEKAFGRVWI
jgi:hypothetical protein